MNSQSALASNSKKRRGQAHSNYNFNYEPQNSPAYFVRITDKPKDEEEDQNDVDYRRMEEAEDSAFTNTPDWGLIIGTERRGYYFMIDGIQVEVPNGESSRPKIGGGSVPRPTPGPIKVITYRDGAKTASVIIFENVKYSTGFNEFHVFGCSTMTELAVRKSVPKDLSITVVESKVNKKGDSYFRIVVQR